MRKERSLRYLSRYPTKSCILDWDVSLMRMKGKYACTWRRWNYDKNESIVRRMLKKFERPGQWLKTGYYKYPFAWIVETQKFIYFRKHNYSLLKH